MFKLLLPILKMTNTVADEQQGMPYNSAIVTLKFAVKSLAILDKEIYEKVKGYQR